MRFLQWLFSVDGMGIATRALLSAGSMRRTRHPRLDPCIKLRTLIRAKLPTHDGLSLEHALHADLQIQLFKKLSAKFILSIKQKNHPRTVKYNDVVTTLTCLPLG